MATQTLAEAKKLINNQIVQGVVEDIISVNPINRILPYTSFQGQGIIVNREATLGDAGFYAVGDTITHKNPGTYDQTVFAAVSLIGDVELNGLVRATSASAGVDQLAAEISSKAKYIGRLFQGGVAGTAAGSTMNSLHSLVDSEQYTTASAGQALSFALLDELLDLVKAKDGQVDFLLMPKRTRRAYLALLRSVGGASVNETVTLKDGYQTIAYNGVPIFINDYLSVTETANGAALTGGALTSVYAGCLDDGTNKIGIAAIHPETSPAGIDIGTPQEMETKDATIIRLKQYVNLASFNRRGLARLTSINN
jgi:hypothetical protein